MLIVAKWKLKYFRNFIFFDAKLKSFVCDSQNWANSFFQLLRIQMGVLTQLVPKSRIIKPYLISDSATILGNWDRQPITSNKEKSWNLHEDTVN